MGTRKHDTRGFTTVLTAEQFNERIGGSCPACGAPIRRKVQTRTDDEGRRRYGGTFWGCSNFGLTCNAGYTLGFDLRRGVPTEYRYHPV